MYVSVCTSYLQYIVLKTTTATAATTKPKKNEISFATTYLAHLQPTFRFYTLLKHQKTQGFLMSTGGVEEEHWLKMG